MLYKVARWKQGKQGTWDRMRQQQFQPGCFGGHDEKSLNCSYILKVEPIGYMEYMREIMGDPEAFVSIIGRVEFPFTV